MTKEQKNNDFVLTYRDVEEILGLKQRSIQNLANRRVLERQYVFDDKSGKQAVFSKRQVEEYAQSRGVQQRGAAAPTAMIEQAKGAVGESRRTLNELFEALTQRDEKIIALATQKGELEGELKTIRPQLEKERSRNTHLEAKIAVLEPKVAQLTEKLHGKETQALQEETKTVNAGKKSAQQVAIVGWAGFVIIFILFVVALFTAPQLSQLRQAINIP